MIEKVNPNHPDKIADRIAGAIVDLAYEKQDNPKIAVEVLIGHGECSIIIESNVSFKNDEIEAICKRISGEDLIVRILSCCQDKHLAENQSNTIKCGDNGIFKGSPLTKEQKELSEIARKIYKKYPFDGKYILNDNELTICQSNAEYDDLNNLIAGYNKKINPLGYWTGGINVDSGATNRKLGSDMADSVTGGGLHGKDLSKADVSVNIWAFLEAQKTGKEVKVSCSIGDDKINNISYSEIVEIAKNYIKSVGGFEKFAEWGLF